MVALWNNLRAAADKNGWGFPPEPLYLIKPSSSFVAHGQPVRRPRSYDGRILFEGELGVVIGQRCMDVAPDDVNDAIFGYTCVNDVTALDLITADSVVRAVEPGERIRHLRQAFGPVMTRGIEPDDLVIKTLAGGKVRQDYPVSDMFFSPRQLVSLISRDMTLMPGGEGSVERRRERCQSALVFGSTST